MSPLPLETLYMLLHHFPFSVITAKLEAIRIFMYYAASGHFEQKETFYSVVST